MKRLKRNGMLQKAAVLFTVFIFTAAAFAATAFATEITPAPDPAAPAGSQTTPDVPTTAPVIPPTSDPNAGTSVDPNGPTIPSDPNTTTPSVDPNAPVTSPGVETPSDPNASSPSDGTGSQPTDGESSEVVVSTPEESRQESQYRPPVSKKPTPSVNTDNAQINQAASKAAQATSDPDLLSSQDWSELLTSGEVSQSPDAKPFEKNPPNGGDGTGDGGNQGSFSWILPFGIALIVLGLGGIAFFAYAQFFAPRRRKNTLDDGTGEIEAFTDINSDSSGLQQRGDYLPQEDEAGEEPSEAAQEADEEPVEEAVTEETEPSADALTEEPPMRAQFEIAQPDVRFVENAKPGEPSSETPQADVQNPYGFKVEIMEDKKDENGNFDWDSFFDDDK